MNHNLLRPGGVGVSGRGWRDEVRIVGSVGERHVQPDLGPCVWAAGKQVSVGVPTRQVWGPAPRGRLLTYDRSCNGGLRCPMLWRRRLRLPRRHSCRRRGDQKSPLRAGGPRHNPGLLARQSVTFRNRICEMMQMYSLGPNYSAGGISSMATTLTAKHAVATRNVYPTISPNRSRATARMGIAQNGWMRLVVPSPYA